MTTKNIKYKCSLCFYDAFNRDNIEKHIKTTKDCEDAEILEIEIKCDFCEKTFTSEISKISHDKICKSKKLDEELEGLSLEDQNILVKKRFSDQNKYIENIEKQLRLLKNKFAREEEVNNQSMKNEHGFSANELHSYCIFTVKRLFEDLTLPAITSNLESQKKESKIDNKTKADAKS